MNYRDLTKFFGLLAVLLSAAPAMASTVSPTQTPTMLYDSASIIQGEGSYVQGFDITTAGTLTMTLTQIPWLDTVSNLTGFVTTPSGVLGTSMGVGTESFKVGPGMVYAHWYGDAQGVFDAGVVGVTVQFMPAVPLPDSLLLLGSGLVLLLAWQRRARPASQQGLLATR